MKFYSTNNKDHKVTLGEAVIRGLAPDNGLYMPEQIPVLSRNFFNELSEKSFREIAFEVAENLIGGDLTSQEIKKIVDHTIQFDAPIVEIEKDIYSLDQRIS